ncbi:hypothetical protein Pcinc_002194 [Petrolisthes cinctipes]|uniref:Uncharacterized protein n=1 Tax=Petrolisthes cinctipes TaxID=88211 RepID=A0AAE1L3T0_PETCI|nr:hypothetical protein Pcinc_002194 [Petrolisthes cinctipes]
MDSPLVPNNVTPLLVRAELCLPPISESPATLLLVPSRPYLNSSAALTSTKTLHFTSFLYLIHMSCVMELRNTNKFCMRSEGVAWKKPLHRDKKTTVT